jgi:hypothetical protein
MGITDAQGGLLPAGGALALQHSLQGLLAP